MNDLGKKISSLCLAGLATVTLYAQSGNDAVFSGDIKGYTGKDTLFCYFQNENAQRYDTVEISKDGTFKFCKSLKAEENVPVFWKGRNVSQPEIIYVTLTPGEELQAHIVPLRVKDDSVALEVTFEGKNAKKSESTYKSFVCLSESKDFTIESLAKIPDFKTCLRFTDERFNKLSDILRQIEDLEFVHNEQARLQQYAVQIAFSYAKAREQQGVKMENDKNFVDYVKAINMNDTANVNAVCGYIAWYCEAHPELVAPLKEDAARLKALKVLVSNQDVRNQVANRLLSGLFFLARFGADLAGSEMKDFYEQYLDVSTDTTYRAFVNKQMEVIKRNMPGQEAVDFPIQTADGKTISFKSIVGNGKVTYIDFWATWCGPCCMEIPYLENLVRQYAGNDSIRFVSISIDTNVDAWKKKIENDKPEWAQYIIPEPSKSEGVNYYNITAIPRFMIFDKKGLLYQASASRPSDESTKTLIDDLIKK